MPNILKDLEKLKEDGKEPKVIDFLFCWKLTVEDKLNKSVVIVETKKSEINNEIERIVDVDCEFDKGSEVKYFLDKGLHYLKDYNLETNTVEGIRKDVEKQLKTLKSEDLKPDDKVKVKIKYSLGF